MRLFELYKLSIYSILIVLIVMGFLVYGIIFRSAWCDIIVLIMITEIFAQIYHNGINLGIVLLRLRTHYVFIKIISLLKKRGP